jgi:pilus assembly protein CpaE
MSKEGNNTAGAEKPAFMAFVSDSADIETLKAFAVFHQWAQADINQGDIKTATQFLKNHTSPTLLLVEIPSAAEAPALLDALANVCDPHTKVITIGSVNEYSFYCWLMDIGIFSYLLKPMTLPALEGAFKKSTETHAAHAKEDKKLGKVIAVMGTRGGVGATTVSLNLAGVLADRSKTPVALIDIDPHGGSIALALDIEPGRGLREAIERPDRIDSLFMDRVMIKPHKNLSVLSAEEAMHDQIMPHAEAAELLLAELRAKFGVVLIDIPRRLNAGNLDFLKRADQIVLVTELTLLSLRDALRISDMIRDVLKLKPPIIVANRIGMVPKQEMQVPDYEKGINAKVACRIPFVPDVYMQISNDIPSMKMKGLAAIRPIIELTEQLVPEVKQKHAAADKKGFRLFKSKQ